MNTYSKSWLFLFLILYAIVHSMLWSQNPPDADPINFVTALSRYDISIDSPHPPGYPAYVGLAKLAAKLVTNAKAYQLVNLCLLLCTAMCVFLALEKVNLKTEAWFAIAIILTHPLVLPATLVQESYMADACFGAVLFAWVIFYHRNVRLFLLGITLIFYFFGLFRVVSDVLLMPLVVLMVWLFSNKNVKFVALTLGCAALATILAWLTTVYIAGGFEVYHQAASRVMGGAVKASSVFAGASVAAHANMLGKLAFWAFFYSLPLLMIGLALRLLGRGGRGLATQHNYILLAWAMPALAFYALIYYLKPFYLLVFVPPYAIALASLINQLFIRISFRAAYISLFLIITLHLILFFAPNKHWHYSLYRSSYAYIQDQDHMWIELRDLISQLPKQDTLFIWGNIPGLSIYTVRLLDLPDNIALVNEDRKTLQFVTTKHLQWQPELAMQEVMQNSYQRIAVLSRPDEHFRLNITEISHQETHSLADFDWHKAELSESNSGS